MTKNYELVFIVNPVLSKDELKKTNAKFVKFIKDNKGKIIHEEEWGIKQLAYPIKHKTTGAYYLIQFELEGDLINKFETEFNRDENVLRYVFTLQDKFSLDYNERRRNGQIGQKNKKETNKEKVKEEA